MLNRESQASTQNMEDKMKNDYERLMKSSMIQQSIGEISEHSFENEHDETHVLSSPSQTGVEDDESPQNFKINNFQTKNQ